MAKQKDIKTTPWEPFARAGARIVRVRAQELFDHAENVLDTNDIERVHDMRVASRRLRAVLEIFAACFPKAEYRSVLRDVKRLADALGERRDPDVHIAAMEAFAEGQPAATRPGIARLTEDLRTRQARGNEILAAELERMRERDLHGRLMALSDGAEDAIGDEEAAAVAVEAAEPALVPGGDDGPQAPAAQAQDGDRAAGDGAGDAQAAAAALGAGGGEDATPEEPAP
jgi:CHAD domain-containing protein